MQLFVSHSGKDRAYVDLLAKRLESAGCTAYLAEYDVSGVGHDLNQKLRSAIKQSDAMVVLLTLNAANSAIVREEIGFALGLGRAVIPLVEPEVANDPALLGMLQGIEHIPFDKNEYRDGWIRLTDVINQMVLAKVADAHLVETEILTARINDSVATVAQLQARNDVVTALLLLAGAVAFVAITWER